MSICEKKRYIYVFLIFYSKHYDKYMAYMSTKLMQVVSSKDLNARLKADGKPVRVYSVHPGVIYTELYSNLWYLQPIGCIVKKMFKVFKLILNTVYKIKYVAFIYSYIHLSSRMLSKGPMASCLLQHLQKLGKMMGENFL